MEVNIMWFRRDLRLIDNAALYYALRGSEPVVPVFIFDKIILDQLEQKADRRVEFIHAVITEMQDELKKHDTSLEVYYGKPLEVFKELIQKHKVKTIYTNHDYEPYATERDDAVKELLEKNDIGFKTYKDQVIFDKDEILKDDGTPYIVFTPYSRKWRDALTDFYLKSYPTKKYFPNFYKQKPKAIPSLDSMGFKKVDEPFPSKQIKEDIIKHYGKTRDYPGNDNATSRLGLHLRFGTVSIRILATKAKELSSTYLNELIWREFYHMILWHFPKVGKGRAFREEYENIKWLNNEDHFKKWCEGQTGYPIVDAGMRELNSTGFMHNRVRMIVASFLAKHLLIDWRWGEAYFAEKLLDYDLANNNGGWQWSAGSGVDAAPYFRVFNPYLQTKKFDSKLEYVKKWVPEFEEFNYPKPIVEHEMARKRAIDAYQKAVKKTS